jgi:uncharacterized protein
MSYEQRAYRKYTSTEGLVSFTVTVKETDLFISASKDLKDAAYEAVVQARFILESYIHYKPEFLTSLVPLPLDAFAPSIIRDMLDAAAICNVGPMAAVAGAVSDYVGTRLMEHAEEIIVENGGDIYLNIKRDITAGVFAGPSPLSERMGITISANDTPCGICTSSGTVGPSLSFGRADAVTIKASTATAADAAATAIGNLVIEKSDIQKALDAAKLIPCIDGILIIKDDTVGVWGNIHLVSL